jgi:hypothetical protein
LELTVFTEKFNKAFLGRKKWKIVSSEEKKAP